jgi:Lsr2
MLGREASPRRLCLISARQGSTEGEAMAPSATAMLIDDTGQWEASETVRFGLDGCAYEIELSARQASELRSMAGRYISAARRIHSAPSRAAAAPGPAAYPGRPGAVPADPLLGHGEESLAAAEADVRGGGHGLTDREKQELRTIADAAKPGRAIVAGRLRTRGLADRDSAGNWWLTGAGRRELMSA